MAGASTILLCSLATLISLCQDIMAQQCNDQALCMFLDASLCKSSTTIQIDCPILCGTCATDTYCPDITPITHGDTLASAGPPYKVGTTVNFNCDQGFVETGVTTITCLNDGKWSNQPPVCTAIICNRDLSKLEGGRTCPESCEKIGFCVNTLYTCQCDDWCGKSCFDTNAQCKVPSNPTNGFVDIGSRRYGQKVTYSCQSGYALVGPSSRKCRSDRKWTGYDPFCVPFGACGFTEKKEENTRKVVHGKDAGKGDWPWQVSIVESAQYSVDQLYKISVFGGGSVIDEGWVLSAAHVFDLKFPTNVVTKQWKDTFMLVFGMTAYVKQGSEISSHIQIFEPAEVFLHPKFDTKSLDYDVALVRIGNKLKRDGNKFVIDTSAPGGKVTFTRYVRPVCLPCVNGGILKTVNVWRDFDKNQCHQNDKSIFPTFAATGESVVLTGFGYTNPITRQQPLNLQEGLLNIVNPLTCAKDVVAIRLIVRDARFTERMFCASGGNESKRIDACQGDSGGPVVKEEAGIAQTNIIKYWMQVGIVSWGLGCASNFHGYYASVPSVMGWVWTILDDARKGVWSSWSHWSSCTVTCGGGVHTRQRQCGGPGNCDGEKFEMTFCRTELCPVRCKQNELSVDPQNPCSGFYYQCDNGVSRKRPCPATLKFNKAIDQCDYARNIPACAMSKRRR